MAGGAAPGTRGLVAPLLLQQRVARFEEVAADWSPAGSSSAATSNQTVLPPSAGRQPHECESPSIRTRPRPLVPASSAAPATGGRTLWSQTSTRRSSPVHFAVTERSVPACWTALVRSSLAHSSTSRNAPSDSGTRHDRTTSMSRRRVDPTMATSGSTCHVQGCGKTAVLVGLISADCPSSRSGSPGWPRTTTRVAGRSISG